MSAQIQQASILSGRQLILAVTIALHGAAISALLAWKIAEVVVRGPDIRLVDVTQDKPRELPPPESRDPIVQTFIGRLPDKQPDLPIEEEGRLIAPQMTEGNEDVHAKSGSATPESSAPPADTALKHRATRPSDDYYPPQAIRLAQEGVTIVRVCVDATGAQSAAPQVIHSSRSRLLDAAAVNWAREALQFTPATHAGAAVAACKDFRVNFTLH